MTDNAPVAPWYRQPWFWFMTIFQLASIMWGITTLVVSSTLDNSMESDDYSKEGRGINMSIARDERAAEQQLPGELRVQHQSATLVVDTADGATDYPYLAFNLYHPTLPRQHKTVQFTRVPPGEYGGQLF